MPVKTGQSAAGTFLCKGATGALATPSVGPAGVLYVNGVANGASVTISGANPYKWAVTLPALSAGDVVQIYITATIATIATGGFVWEETAETVLPSDLSARIPAALVGGRIDASAGAIANDAITAAAIATDAIDADAITADAVAEIKTGLALESTLTAIKGAGWSATTDTLEAIRDAAAGALGPGTTAKTYTVYESDGSTGLEGVLVILSTSSTCTGTVWAQYSNASGETYWRLDSGTTYYLWRFKSDRAFTNPDTEVA